MEQMDNADTPEQLQPPHVGQRVEGAVGVSVRSAQHALVDDTGVLVILWQSQWIMRRGQTVQGQNCRRQHGQRSSKPLSSERKAYGCGSVMIARKATGAR